MAVKDYIRQRFFPHLWCSGCGHGIVLNGLIRSVERLGMSRNEMVMVSGIGCSSRISGYMDFHTLHTITFSSGLLSLTPVAKASARPWIVCSV